nr:hypothetical protein [Succinivibrionaceae bacterium]
MRDPVFETEELAPSSCRVRFRAAADLDWFRGHFDGLPVLPGIAQIYFVTLALGKISGAAGRSFRIAGFSQVKFTFPMTVGDEAELSVRVDGGGERLDFEIRSPGGTVFSEGHASLSWSAS